MRCRYGSVVVCGFRHIKVFVIRIFLAYMSRYFLAYGCLVERTVEGRNEEHYNLGAHTEIQHDVGSGQVGELKQCTKDNDRRTPTVSVVQERLSRHAVEPPLQAVDDIIFAVFCHVYFFFCFELVVLARLLTHRKPM